MSQLTTILNKALRQKTMDKALEVLRSYRFVFVSYEVLKEWGLSENIKEIHQEYSFMLHEITPGTVEKRGKYDTSLILGIKLNGKRNSNIHIYEDLRYTNTNNIDWKDAQGILFRNVKVRVKFPTEMSYDDRKKWRSEDKKVKRKPDREKSEFYKKWAPLIKTIEKN